MNRHLIPKLHKIREFAVARGCGAKEFKHIERQLSQMGGTVFVQGSNHQTQLTAKRHDGTTIGVVKLPVGSQAIIASLL